MAQKLDFGLLQICVAEDDRFMQKLIKSMLLTLGVNNIRMAFDGDEAYELLSSVPSDLIIIDWSMKPTSGIDLLHKIRNSKAKPLADTPAIMLTAHSERKYVEKAVIAGANDYLVKPVSPRLLRQRINGLFKDSLPLSHQNKAKTASQNKVSSPASKEGQLKDGPPDNTEDQIEIVEL